jgi:hypothetical protein
MSCIQVALVTAFLGVFGFNAPARLFGQGLNSISLEPLAVPAGGSPTGVVRITAPALAPVEISLLSSNPMLAFVPGTVTIPAGQLSANFRVTTDVRRTNLGGCVEISARLKGTTRTAALLVQIPSFGARVALNFRDALTNWSGPLTGTVTLTEPAPAGGAKVTLSSSVAGVAAVPSALTIRSGSTSLTFPISLRANGCTILSGTMGGATARRGLIVGSAGLSQ